MSDLVLLERDGPVATLVLNDPDRRNAMSHAMGERFRERVAELGRDESVRAVILTGAGRAFSGGGDLSMIGARAAEAAGGSESAEAARRAIRDIMRGFYGLFLSIRDLPCPTIAAVQGHAVGAGLCVALACDLRIVAREARLALNFTRLGLHPGMGATWTLPRLVPPEVAAELLFTGRTIRGEEAAALGLARRALPAEEVLPAARALAAEIAAAAPRAVRGVKRALRRSEAATLEDQLLFEATEQAACFGTEDVREGLRAAAERRDPRFTGG